MRSEASYIAESDGLTRQLREAANRPWPTNREALTQRGIDVERARVIDRIEDGDYLDYMLVASGERRVFLYFVTYEPSTQPEVIDWQDITDGIESNPHAGAINAVLSVMAK